MKKIAIALVLATLIGCASVKVTMLDNDMAVSFRVKAQKVLFYSSVNGFTPVQADGDGKNWTAVIPKAAQMRYFVVADGRTYLPECTLKEKDDFGGELCIYQR